MEELNNTGIAPPIKVGEVYNLDVEGFGSKGDPFGKVLNFIVFIKLPEETKVNLGDKLIVKIKTVTPKQAFSEIASDE